MSQPVAKRHCYDDQQDAELARWPGVTWSRQVRSKHYALVLTFGSVSRFVTYPCSPGDTIRGGLNHLRDVRAALRAMGAERLPEPRSATPHRRRATSAAVEPIRIEAQAGTRLGRDPFAALAVLQLKAPEPVAEPVTVKPLGFWGRVKAWWGIGR